MVGIFLTAIGVISLIYQGVTFTTREKVIDFGPIQAYKQKKQNHSAPPHPGRVSHRGRDLADRRRG